MNIVRGLLLVCWLLVGVVQVSGQSYLEADIDNDAPFVGEAFVYTFRFFDDGERIGKTFAPPLFRGLGQVGEGDVGQRSALVEGVQYTVFEQAFYLYGLEAGEVSIASGRIEAPETPFQDAEVILGEAIDVSIRPLPVNAYGVLHGVGQYRIAFDVSAVDLAVDEAMRVTLTVSGRGILQTVLAPDLTVDESWRVLENPVQYRLDSAIEGEKVFTWDIIPTSGGDFRLGVADFVYFEPVSERYVILSSDLIAVRVTGEDGMVTSDVRRGDEEFELVWRDVELREVSSWGWLWGILWLLPVIVFGGVVLWQRGNCANFSFQAGQGRGRYSQRLNALATLEARAIHEGVADLLLAYVSVRLGYEVTEGNLEEALQGLNKARAEALWRCWQEATQARYAPVDDEDARHLMRRVRRFLGEDA